MVYARRLFCSSWNWNFLLPGLVQTDEEVFSMSSSTRRRFTAEKKADIVRRHLGDKVAVSDLADEVGVQPSHLPEMTLSASDDIIAMDRRRGT